MKKIGVFFATIIMIFMFAASASALDATGKCGENVYWEYNSSTAKLVISGTGAMYDYDYYYGEPSPFYFSNIKSVVIKNGITSIGETAFYYCTKLTSVEIGESVTKIGDSAFAYCKGITGIKIGNKVTTVGDFAFLYCEKLESVSIGSGVKNIGLNAFGDCINLETISVNKDNSTYSSDGGVLFDKGKTKLIQYPIGSKKNSYTIPKTVTVVGEYAFRNCKNLESVFMGDSVTTIGEKAFMWCEYIVDVDLGSVATIKKSAFEGCTQLSVIRMRDSVKKIEAYSFQGCNLLPKKEDKFTEERGIYFFGTSSDYSKISISSNNETLKKAKKTFAYSHKKYEKEDADITKNVFDGNAVALLDYIVPGVHDDMIPQGLAYYENGTQKWFLISAYHKPEDDEDIKNPGVIYALDANTGEFVAQFNLYNVGGTVCTAHLGGIAVSENNVYVTYYDNKVAFFPLNEIVVKKGTVKDIRLTDSMEIKALAEAKNKNKNKKRATTAYIEICDGVLWTGNFYCKTPGATIFGSDSYKYKATKNNNSIIVGYELTGNDSYNEWNTLSNMSKESHRINLANDVHCLQGATVHKNKLYISATLNASFSSEVWVAELDFNNENVTSLSKKDFSYKGKNIDGAEEIIIVDNYLYSVYESAALRNQGGFIWNDWFKSTSGVMTKVNINYLKPKTVNVFNCPIDIEVVDITNNEVVCRIINNKVDEEISSKDGALLAEVVGNTKYIYTPEDRNYEFKIAGNGTGEMDYTVVRFDEKGNETERINFFDVEINEDSCLSGNLNYTDNNFEFSKYSLTGTDNVISSEYIVDANKYYDISLIGSIGGTTVDSFTCTSGDTVRISATCDQEFVFDGWYEDNKLISKEIDFDFVARSDRAFEARFKKCDHEIGEWYIEKPATCEESGEYCRGCLFCNYSELEIVQALGHGYESVETTPTCTEGGYTIYICSGCGDDYIADETVSLGHKYESVVTAPNCIEEGFTTYICSNCGDNYTADQIPSLGHNMSEIIPIVASSCESEGQDMIKCTRCEYGEIQQIEATGHYDNDSNNICDGCGKELLASSKCSCNCHKTGFMSFIWKILRFFYKLFKINKVCGCGAIHY